MAPGSGQHWGMITRELALALRDAGLAWHPSSGDAFQLDLPANVEAEVEADVFTVSEMTIEARRPAAHAGRRPGATPTRT